MSALSNLLIENKALMFGAAALAFIVAAILILLVFRLAFGRRLRMPGGRARQMRLGIVDAFDLDRQRQLVIVRRDNVEHLIMIGGPNDILIESQIVRAEAREMRGRDKEMREPGQAPAPSAKPPTIEPKLPIPQIIPEPSSVATAEDHAAPPATGPSIPLGPASRTPSSIQRPLRSPLPPPSTRPLSTPHVPGGEGEPHGKPLVPSSLLAHKPPTSPKQPPGFARWPARPVSPPVPKDAETPAHESMPAPVPPPLPSEPLAPAAAQPPADAEPPQPPTQVAGPPVLSLEGLESLEEEMAKLLGRSPIKPENP